MQKISTVPQDQQTFTLESQLLSTTKYSKILITYKKNGGTN